MIGKDKLFWLILLTISVVAFIVIKTGKTPDYKKGASTKYDSIIGSAMNLYKKRVVEKLDMSKGPCLTNDLMPGWVVDIVHSPREQIDDLPANQCQAYIEGRASHFVELDINGNFVRMK